MYTTRKPSLAPLHTCIEIQFQWNGTCAIPPIHWLEWKGTWQCQLLYYLSGMGFMPFHYTMVVMDGNVTMPPFLPPKYNGIRAIPVYIDINGMQLWQCQLVDYCLRWN